MMWGDVKALGFFERLYFSQQARHALKTGLAAVLAVWVYGYFHLPHGYWAVIAAVLVMQSNRDSGSFEVTLRLALHRVIGTVTGAFSGLAFLVLFAPSHTLLLFLIFFLIVLGSYLTSLYKGFNLFGPTASIMLLLAHQTALTHSVAFERALDIVVGVVIATVVTVSIWPYSLLDHLKKHRQRTLALLQKQCALLMSCCQTHVLEPAWLKQKQALTASMRQAKEHLPLVRKSMREQEKQFVHTESRLVRAVGRLGESLPKLPEAYWLFPQLQEATERVLCCLRDALGTARTVTANDVDAALEAYSQVFQAFREARQGQAKDASTVEQVYHIMQVQASLRQCCDIMHLLLLLVRDKPGVFV